MENLEKKLTDLEIALQLANHIENPCGVVIEGKTYNIRDFYLRLAREATLRLTNPYAKEFLESVINAYA